MLTEKKINEIKTKIVDAIYPEKILLFGSYARGDVTEDSDLDLVVIWETDLNPHQRNLFLSRLFPKRDFSLDLFAFTKRDAEVLRDIPGTILYEAFHNGRIIYGR